MAVPLVASAIHAHPLGGAGRRVRPSATDKRNRCHKQQQGEPQVRPHRRTPDRSRQASASIMAENTEGVKGTSC
jgi:hypothetical protein